MLQDRRRSHRRSEPGNRVRTSCTSTACCRPFVAGVEVVDARNSFEPSSWRPQIRRPTRDFRSRRTFADQTAKCTETRQLSGAP